MDEHRHRIESISHVIGPVATADDSNPCRSGPRGRYGAGEVNRFRNPNSFVPRVPITQANVPPNAPAQGEGVPLSPIPHTAATSGTAAGGAFTAGYSSLSDFISSDEVFFIFRRFDRLSIRNLLCLQAEISDIESRLNTLDQQDGNSGTPERLRDLHSWLGDSNEERNQLLLQVREKLEKYHSALDLHARLMRLDRPKGKYTQSLSNWVEGNKPTVEEESHFLDNRSDLSAIARRDDRAGPLESVLEDHFSRLFTTAEDRNKSHAVHDEHVRYYSTDSIRRTARAVMVVTAVAMLILPVGVLYVVRSMPVRLGLICSFSFLFALTLALGTQSRNQDLFIAVAAYMAVLVVFVGSNPAEQSG